MRPFLGYHFFHTVGNIAPREAFARTQRAMQSFTDCPEPTRCAITLNVGTERQGPLEAAGRILCDTYGVNAWLLFPFETPSNKFASYASTLQRLLIFKFLPKHWRIWKYYKTGEWRPRHFEPNLASTESA
jgi:hypothetical protein